ncbi:hypothetical protein [Vibrio sp. M260121]|uniref:hypothetical protein n=1 Tax=Vibrio sp. M260121 TaxID=3020897 RepID=UPI002F416B2E
MLKKHSITVGLLCLVSIMFVAFYLNIPAYNEQISEGVSSSKSEPELNNKATSLSDEVAFPSPVIQLQQTMVDGMIQTSEPSLPLIRGDLQAFSDENIDKKYPSPRELEELEARLKQLKKLQQSLSQ